MADSTISRFIAFEGSRRIATGSLEQVALKCKQAIDARPHARLTVFNQASSELVDFDLRGTPEQILKRLGTAPGSATAERSAATPDAARADLPAGPGRPRLGVVSREVTLLPRHWQWLNSQPGGASVALRKLVDQARRSNLSRDAVRASQEAAYRFMSTMAGNRPGFEEAARALFAADRDGFLTLSSVWPSDIRNHLEHLATPAFEARDPQHETDA